MQRLNAFPVPRRNCFGGRSKILKTVFAADIGSKCIKCVARGQVAAEETAIALEAGAKLTVAAAGNAALLHRSGVIRPVRDGAAANTRMLALLLGRLACEKTGKRTTASIELHARYRICCPR